MHKTQVNSMKQQKWVLIEEVSKA